MITPRFFKTNSALVLASGSPRRKDFLEKLGLNFTVQPANIEENLFPNETPKGFVTRLSLAKAKDVSLAHKDAWVIGADTVVAIEDDILGKPTTQKEAMEMLIKLNGKWHEVWTGFAIYQNNHVASIKKVISTRVKFWQHTEGVLKAYVKTGEPMDKAGAYGIQGKGGILVEKIEGSYSNVVGLPLAETVNALMELDLISPRIE